MTLLNIFGVTKFYLYDQGSTDNWKEYLSDYIARGVVVPFNWNFDWLKPSVRHQVSIASILLSRFDFSTHFDFAILSSLRYLFTFR